MYTEVKKIAPFY